ncbi:MAG: beta-galactosidase [Planctomycetota bacterium]
MKALNAYTPRWPLGFAAMWIIALAIPQANASSAIPEDLRGPSIVDFAHPDVEDRVRHRGGSLEIERGQLTYRIEPKTDGVIVLTPADQRWDVTGFSRLSLDIEGLEGEEIKIKATAKNPNATDWSNSAGLVMYVDGGQRVVRPVYLPQKRNTLEQFPEMQVFEAMNGLPGGFFTHWRTVDAANLIELVLHIEPKPYNQELRIHAIQASHPVISRTLLAMGEDFFPFIDRYGQYRHDTWPGKVASDEELRQSFIDEESDLAANPPFADRSRWGGWKDGPKQTATGFFRTEKIDGQWWLVDPDGYLFWSHGVTGVGTGGARTRIEGRESYFTLPTADHASAAFLEGGQYDFTSANLSRALGENWRQAYLDRSHDRLASWGMNTLANWSPRDARLMRRTPYTVAIHYGYEDVSEKLPDPFDGDFRQQVRNALEAHRETAGDPWCLGYFVNNELHWNPPMKIVENIFRLKKTSAAKQKFIEQLRETYDDVAKLNERLDTDFGTWDDVLANRETVAPQPIQSDAHTFYEAMCHRFFRICHEEVKRLAPNQLYLGARFHVSNPMVLRAAAKYCDVLSYNLYRDDIEGQSWDGVDLPFMATEFHFGAQDRGMWGIGLQSAASQTGRARLYRDYVTGALRNPHCVGTHWFQYNSQAFTGRGDGENFQVGLTDIGGRPWPELRAAIRTVGQTMYTTRRDAR